MDWFHIPTIATITGIAFCVVAPITGLEMLFVAGLVIQGVSLLTLLVMDYLD